MGALHPKASHWIRRGIFDDLQSFDQFETRVNQVVGEKDRGDIFEIFVEGYLATQAIMQGVDHWVVGDIPLSLRERYKLPSDPTGIDGIYQTHDGTLRRLPSQISSEASTDLCGGRAVPRHY